MPSFDVAADMRVGVFSIRSILIRDDFLALFNSSERVQVHMPTFTKQTGPSLPIWGWAANIAAGARPADTRDRLAHGGHRRPRTREEPTRTHETPSRTQISGDKRGPRQGNRGNPARSRTRGPPSERLHLLATLATTLATSYAPQAGQLHTSWTPQAGHANNGQATSRTTRTRRGRGEQSPRVEGGMRRVTLGILSLLGSGYDFQGWLDLEERGQRIDGLSLAERISSRVC